MGQLKIVRKPEDIVLIGDEDPSWWDHDSWDKEAPPNNVRAEASFLGYVLKHPEQALASLDEICAIAKPTDCYFGSHRRIFEAMLTLRKEGKPIEVGTVQSFLAGTGYAIDTPTLENIVSKATFSIVSAGINAYYVRLFAIMREALHGCRLFMARAKHEVNNINESPAFVREMAAFFERMANSYGDDKESAPVTVTDGLKGMLARMGVPENNILLQVSSESLIQKLNGGFRPGELVFIGARSGMGKSALGFQWAGDIASAKQRGVIVFSMEMRTEEVIQRIVACHGDLSLRNLQGLNIKGDNQAKLVTAYQKTDKWPLMIHDKRMSMAELTARARRSAETITQKFGCPIGAIFVDHLSLIQIPETNRDPHHEKVGQVANALKALAKEMGVTIFCLAQLNRGVEDRRNKDHRPRVSDLRDSGKVEEAADVVLLLYRPGAYSEKVDQSEAELIIGKSRNGATGTIDMKWDPTRMRFEDAWGR